MNGDWFVFAACVGYDPEIFFPTKGGSHYAAKKICASCPVRSECLEYVQTMPGVRQYGIWGGTSENERRTLRR